MSERSASEFSIREDVVRNGEIRGGVIIAPSNAFH